ncbi:hypothetical protein PENSPDRAFT_758492 [Peniophora sp. CONT]|nr:hypothetical protein PENSPDRAFT_758492 [Peniophora sp. CONT]
MPTHGSRTPIAHLPPELLALIFKHVHDIGSPTSIRPGKVLDINDRGMFGLSYVCRRWRELVLSLGSLWASKVDVSRCRPELNQLVLERTGSHQLNMSLQDLSDPDGEDNLILWLEKKCQLRVEVVDMRCFGDDVAAVLSGFFGPSLPVLQHLRVHLYDIDDAYESSDEDSQNGITDYYVSVTTLSVYKAPRLTSAVLLNCVLPWHADVFSQLTHLYIGIDAPFSVPRRQQPTQAQLYSILESMHSLVDLHLENMFFYYTDGMHAVAKPIHLAPTCELVTFKTRSIKNERVNVENFNCSLLAASLVTSDTAIINIEQSCFGNLGHSLRALAGPSQPPCALSLCTAGHPVAASVVVGFDASSWLSSPVDLLGTIPGRHINITFRSEEPFNVEPSEWEPEFFFDQYYDAVHAWIEMEFSKLRALRIEDLRPVDVEPLLSGCAGRPVYGVPDEAPFLENAHDLEVLILAESSDVSMILKALAISPITMDELLFPRLHTVAMRYSRDDRRAIIDFFQARHAAGLPVATFKVVQKDSENDQWEELQEFTDVEIFQASE